MLLRNRRSALGSRRFWESCLSCASSFIVKNASHLRSEHKLESLVSRESSFLFNNLLLLLACFTVLWGTLFPKLSEWVQGHTVTVGRSIL